ncbi:PREDICTED: fatty acid synthase-like [Wasmannia auropunctata]|uniref:fatty acid synthase-like n=1 Tax=Wasmannia auropunctata TaxID=64793 RepID=UPI0005EEE9D6|nr:PREDICTED: fatty acid synthase-like [Wasmannia auropunctata]
MGRYLLKFQVFANAIRMCDDVLKPYNISVTDILTNAEENVCENSLYMFLGIVAVQIGLVDILTSLKITPDYMISHSAGELGCAYADKCLTTEQTILSAYFIGLACAEAKLIRSSMAIVSINYENLKNICPADIEIICRNSENNSVVTGPVKSMQEFMKKLQVNNIYVKEIHCNVPYHSSYLASVKSQLLSNLNKIIPHPKKQSPKWISTSIPCAEWHTSATKLSSADYHTHSILNTVLFEQARYLIPCNAVTIEIAPYGVLQQILEESLHPEVTNILLTRRTEQYNNIIFQGIGRLYNCGLQPQVANLYPPVTLPVSRGTPMISSSIRYNIHVIYFFNLKKSAAEAHRLLVEAYGEAALSDRNCREWFQKFKNGEFDVEGKEAEGRKSYDHKLKSQLSKLMTDGLNNKTIKPLQAKIFPKTDIEKAFRYMASGKHMGKEKDKPLDNDILACPRYYCLKDRSYIILGGLGGFGLELTDWLIFRGARNVVLVSRTGVKNGYQRMKVRLWKSYGVNVLIVKDIDVANTQDCEYLLRTAEREGPVDAIFNLGVVLKDSSVDANLQIDVFTIMDICLTRSSEEDV